MKRVIALILLVCLSLCGCTMETEPAQMTTFCMNTVMDLKIWGKDQDVGLGRIYTRLTALEGSWSATDSDSILSNLNRGNILLQLEPAQSLLLEKVETLSLRTGGAFNPKMRVLSEAWGFYNEAHRVPTQEEIDAALKTAEWDLGGALKGYAGQECADLLAELDIDRAMLVLGGNVQTYGEKPGGKPWTVGIQDPDGGNYLGIVSVTGTASVVTSGDYQRYFEKDGVTYHHILDPKTGYPADSGLRSVTIICRDGLTADCLSTALFVMGLEESIEFWRESNDFEAVFVTTDGSIYATEGANLSGCEFEVINR